MLTDEYFMRLALQEGQKAYQLNEIPVGAVLTSGHTLLARGHNYTEKYRDITAHAEILVLTTVSERYQMKYLTDCTLYVTLEPCVMCAGAIAWAQIGRLVYAADDPKRGFSQYSPSLLHPKTEVTKGILSGEAEKLLKDFFQRLRA